jgi:hypothetical protein
VSGMGAWSGAGALFSWHARRVCALFPACGRGEAARDTQHRRGRCYGPSKLIATAGRSVCSFAWLLFQNFALAVVKKFFLTRSHLVARLVHRTPLAAVFRRVASVSTRVARSAESRVGLGSMSGHHSKQTVSMSQHFRPLGWAIVTPPTEMRIFWTGNCLDTG